MFDAPRLELHVRQPVLPEHFGRPVVRLFQLRRAGHARSDMIGQIFEILHYFAVVVDFGQDSRIRRREWIARIRRGTRRNPMNSKRYQQHATEDPGIAAQLHRSSFSGPITFLLRRSDAPSRERRFPASSNVPFHFVPLDAITSDLRFESSYRFAHQHAAAALAGSADNNSCFSRPPESAGLESGTDNRACLHARKRDAAVDIRPALPPRPQSPISRNLAAESRVPGFPATRSAGFPFDDA